MLADGFADAIAAVQMAGMPGAQALSFAGPLHRLPEGDKREQVDRDTRSHQKTTQTEKDKER